MRHKRLFAYSAVYLLWGGSYLAIRCVVTVVPPLLAAGLRYTTAGLLLAVICFALKREKPATAREYVNAAGTGILALAVSFGAVFWAAVRLPSWNVGILLATSFLWTYLGECVVAKRAPRPGMLAGILMGLLAIRLIVTPTSQRRPESFVAMMVVLAAAWIWSASVLAIKYARMPASFRQTAAVQMSSAGAVLITVSGLMGEWRRLAVPAQTFTWKPVLGMVYLVFAGSLVAFTAFHWLLAHEHPHLVATSSYVNPLVALVSGLLLSREQASPVQLVGAVLLLSSIGMVWYLQDNAAWRRIPTRSAPPYCDHESVVLELD